MNRRKLFLLGAAGVGAGGLAVPAQAAVVQSATRLALTLPVEEGPYYLTDAPLRADISEGLPGVPIELRFEVVDQTGAPLGGAKVEVWHCDAQGRYSGFGDRPGEAVEAARAKARFLRGAQLADGDGRAVFRTVYPGWYPGRTTHIHYKVWVGGAVVLTSQTFLPDALNEFLYAQAPDYRRKDLRDTLNRDDRIAEQAGEAGRSELADLGDRYVVSHRVVVDPHARPAPEERLGPPPGFHPGEGPPPFPPKEGRLGPPPPGIGPPGMGPGMGPPPGFGRPARTGKARTLALLPQKTSEKKREG